MIEAGQAPTYIGSKTAEYLRVVREHVVTPLETTALSESCFAASVLIFATVDGLGKLIHADPNAAAGTRFKAFFQRLGDSYEEHANQLWDLRNSLTHNALNVACFMSKTHEASGEHLEEDNGYLFVHTKQLLEDFKKALDTLEEDFRHAPELLKRSESRLEWGCIGPAGWRNGEIHSTPPPGVSFIRENTRSRPAPRSESV